jgi:hypothetical protein
MCLFLLLDTIEKHAIRVLKNQVQVQNHLKGRPKAYETVYRGEVVHVLEQICRVVSAYAPFFFYFDWDVCQKIVIPHPNRSVGRLTNPYFS